MDTNALILGLCVGLFIFTIITTIISIVCVAIVIGFKNSTHQIEYRDPNWMNEERDEDEVEFDPFKIQDELREKPQSPFKNKEDEEILRNPVGFDEYDKKVELRTKERKEARELSKGLIGEEDFPIY